jgi:putative hydrolase of the HAD superfamily
MNSLPAGFEPASLEAILLDMDDTLYPERDYVLSGFQAVADWAASNLGIPAGAGLAKLRSLFEAGVRGDSFNRWLASYGVDAQQELIQELIAVYRGHEPALTPFADVVPFMTRLQGRYRLGLVSDGYLAVQRRKLASLGLAPYLDAVVFSDQWGREAWKPDTRPFIEALQLLQVEAGNAVYLGDNPAKDFLGARQLGIWTVWVRRSRSEYGHLAPPGADHAPHFTVSSLSALEAVFSPILQETTVASR